MAANLDARLLAQHVLGWDSAKLLASAGDAAPDSFPAPFEALVARRVQREPLAYITGHKEFYDLEFEVTPAVLIPRPETELIVDATLASTPAIQIFTMIDACTGCGNVAVAVAKHRPNARIVATDISEPAIEVARRNAARHNVASRVTFVVADLFGDQRPRGHHHGQPAACRRTQRTRSSAGGRRQSPRRAVRRW
jgi:release factor glutamine methyltransferase